MSLNVIFFFLNSNVQTFLIEINWPRGLPFARGLRLVEVYYIYYIQISLSGICFSYKLAEQTKRPSSIMYCENVTTEEHSSRDFFITNTIVTVSAVAVVRTYVLAFLFFLFLYLRNLFVLLEIMWIHRLYRPIFVHCSYFYWFFF